MFPFKTLHFFGNSTVNCHINSLEYGFIVPTWWWNETSNMVSTEKFQRCVFLFFILRDTKILHFFSSSTVGVRWSWKDNQDKRIIISTNSVILLELHVVLILLKTRTKFIPWCVWRTLKAATCSDHHRTLHTNLVLRAKSLPKWC